MNSKNTKSSHELKKEVIHELRRVEDDLDRIERRLSPGQFIDEAIFQGKNRGPRETFDYLKSNPIGTTFLTMGTILLMEDEDTHLSYEEMMRVKSSQYYNETRERASSSIGEAKASYHQAMDKAQNLKQKVVSKFHKDEASSTDFGTGFVEKEATPSMGERISDQFSSAGESLKENLSGVAQSAVQTARSKMDSSVSGGPGLKERVSGAISSAKETLGSASESMRSRGHEAYTIARNLDPLTYVALGASLGAITGATLPVSEKEGAFVDERLNLKFEEFKKDLKEAMDQSKSSLKNDFFNDLKDFNFNLF